MKDTTKIIISIVIMVSILVGTFGITIFNHICGHTGQIQTSLFSTTSCDHNLNSVELANSNDSHSCCHQHNDNHTNNTNNYFEDDSCCSDNFKTNEIDDNFINNTLEKINVKIALAVDFDKYYNNIKDFNKKIEQKFKSLNKKFKNLQKIIIKVVSFAIQLPSQDNPEKSKSAI